MKSWLKIGGGAILAIVVLVIAAVVIAERMAVQRAQRQIEIAVEPVAYRDDAASLARGLYLYESRGCADCHATNGGGRTLVDDGKGTRLAGSNITLGNPSIAAYAEADWVRSIRHGVAPDRRPLRLMPSEDFNRLTDDDLAAIVAHVRKLPPLDGNLKATIELPLPARVLYGFGAIPEAVEKIDHSLPPSRPVPEGVTVEYGAYVAQACKGCHGPQLDGGRIPGAPPDWPPATRLTAGEDSALARYPDAVAFATMIKTGKRADGTAIAVMPFESLSKMSDVDLQALFTYLKSLQAGT